MIDKATMGSEQRFSNFSPTGTGLAIRRGKVTANNSAQPAWTI